MMRGSQQCSNMFYYPSPRVENLTQQQQHGGGGPTPSRQQVLGELQAAGRIPSCTRFRSMPCQTFVACGNCPYNERCVFLHDNRVKHSKRDEIAARATPQNNSIKDTFYWPDMPASQLEATWLPSNDQCYSFPLVSSVVRSRDNSVPGQKPNMHDKGVFSLWNHFVYLFDTNAKDENEYSNTETNIFTRSKRLDVFIQLAQAHSSKLTVNTTYDCHAIEMTQKTFQPSPTSVVYEDMDIYAYC